MSNFKRIGDILIPNPKVAIKKGDCVNYIPMEEISPNNRYVAANQRREYNGGTRFEHNDIIFARITPCLQNRKIGQYISETLSPACGSTEYFVFRSIPNVSDSSYLYYLLKSDLVVETAINSMKGASGRQRAEIQAILDLEIEVPDYKEQIEIGKRLSVYDSLIENNNRRIAILEEMAQRFYLNEIQFFTDTYLLGENVVFKKGKNITKATICDGNIPVVAGGLQPAYYHNKSNAKAPVVTVSASGANAGFVNIYYTDIWASDCSYIDSSSTEYVYYYYVCMKELQDQITFMQRGSAQPHVYPDDIARLEIPNIPQNAISAINGRLSHIFDMVGKLKVKNTILRKTRDHLLPRLISGDIDVSDLPIKTKED